MIKFIKLEKKHSFLHMAGLKQRSKYLEVVNDSAKSLSLDFKFLNHMIIISGWDLVCLIMTEIYLVLALINWSTGDYISGIAASVISIIILLILTGLIIKSVLKIIMEVPKILNKI